MALLALSLPTGIGTYLMIRSLGALSKVQAVGCLHWVLQWHGGLQHNN